jgi:endoglucanase
MTTKQVIDGVKAAGFNTVRIPVSWDCRSTNGVIDPTWLARVKTVVDYCISNNLYVMINIHWDGGWLQDNVNTSAQASVNAKQQNYWTQIANYFKAYNERLMFASANEPNASDATAMRVLLSYHQTFINAVRATGGNNASRTLIIQGPATNFDLTYNLMNTMPTDQIANRLMVEVHYYTPWQFCGLKTDESWGSMFYYWGNGYHSSTETNRNTTWGEESEVDRAMALMKTKFIDKGIPVIVGEFGAIKRVDENGQPIPVNWSQHLASREYFNRYVVSAAKSRGMVPVYWDNGAPDFGIINRYTGAVSDQGVVNALMQGAASTGTSYITLRNRATGLYIDGMGRTSNGSACGQWTNSGSYNQQWIMESAGSYIKLKNRVSGIYLDGMGTTANGSVAGQWGNSTSSNQQWTIENSGGYSRLKNRATGLYIDGMGATTNGSNLGQWGNTNSYNQQWTMTTLNASAREASVEQESLSVKQEELNDGIILSPNPFTAEIKVSIADPEQVTSIVLSDLTGRQIELINSANITSEQTLGNDLRSGIYIVQINGLQRKYTFKVFKK